MDLILVLWRVAEHSADWEIDCDRANAEESTVIFGIEN